MSAVKGRPRMHDDARHERMRQRSLKHYEANRERILERQRVRRRSMTNDEYEQDLARSAERSLRRKYGVTLAQYEALLRKQRGHCALCPAKPNRKRLSVDHNHKTGAIRGLLCDRCNQAIGRLGDDVAGLKRAIAYLDRTERANT